MNKNEYPDLKQAEKALKELKKVWGAFDKEFEEATKKGGKCNNGLIAGHKQVSIFIVSIISNPVCDKFFV